MLIACRKKGEKPQRVLAARSLGFFVLELLHLLNKPRSILLEELGAEMGIAARKRTLDMLVTDKVSLLGYHLPWPGVGRVEKKDTAYRFVQAG